METVFSDRPDSEEKQPVESFRADGRTRFLYLALNDAHAFEREVRAGEKHHSESSR